MMASENLQINASIKPLYAYKEEAVAEELMKVKAQFLKFIKHNEEL